MNVWELVTGSSTIAIDPGNTFWDHLNNLGAGGGLSLHVVPEVNFYSDSATTSVEFEDGDYEVVEYEFYATVELLTDENILQLVEDEEVTNVSS